MTQHNHLQSAIDNQIKKRINRQSPTKYDIDFYQRKITRLQSDNNDMHQELSKLRLRLRRAQDYELKYELVLKQLCSLQSDIDAKDKQVVQMKARMQQLQMATKEKQTKTTNWQTRLLELQSQLNKQRQRAQQAQQSKLQLLTQMRDKQTTQSKRQVQLSKRQFSDKQQSYIFQIRSLKKLLDEKQNIQTVVKSRVQKVRQEKDEQIARLRTLIEQTKSQSRQSLQQKNTEIQQLKQKFQKLFNFQLENIHKSQQDESELFGIEMNGLRQLIGIKNDEIQRLLKELRTTNDQRDVEREEMNNQIAILHQQLYKIERQNQLQLYAMKQRLSKIHSNDIHQTQTRYESMIAKLRQQRKQIQLYIGEKDKIIDDAAKQLQRVKSDYIDRLKQRENRIQQLMQRIKMSGQMNQQQVKNLHQSFHQIQSQKQLMSSQYHTNVGFLNTQIAKQQAMNQSKNQQIKKLHQELSRVKKQGNAVVLEIEGRWKEQRREWQEVREEDRKRGEEMEDKMRAKEREWKGREKQLQRQMDKLQRQNSKLQFIIKQLQTDTQRLNQYIKQLDQQLKRQYKKSQLSSLDSAGIRRQLTAQLDRQKNQLQAIMRIELDKEKKKMDVDITRLRNQNERLQTELVKKNVQCEGLEEEVRRAREGSRNIEIVNKEKLIQYEKKMATLNQQIYLTQNLYQAFLQSKVRGAKGSSG